MVSCVKTPLLIEAEQRLGLMPRIGPANQQVQRVVYELRKLQVSQTPVACAGKL